MAIWENTPSRLVWAAPFEYICHGAPSSKMEGNLAAASFLLALEGALR